MGEARKYIQVAFTSADACRTAVELCPWQLPVVSGTEVADGNHEASSDAVADADAAVGAVTAMTAPQRLPSV